MWSLVILAYITTAVYAQQQNSRRPEQYDNGHGWDIRLAVPGEPGGDYPVLNSIPRTPFSCSRKSPGYYADVETGCQVFRVCTLGSTYGFQSFLCPNGTLFNQEVLVCDWWMNVKCDRSQQLFNDNREKFANLKLGPQLMKDIKKMLTHPMRNPYDKSVMKSNLIVMQEYRPPSGQLFPNGALISGPERPPSNIYIPTKQRQGTFAQNTFISGDLSFAASTPSSQYIPTQDILQQQRLPLQNSNSQGLNRIKNSELINNNPIQQPYYTQNQYNNQRNFQTTTQNVPNGQLQRQLQLQQIRHTEPRATNSPTQQFTYSSNQNGNLIQKNNIPQLSKEGNPHIARVQQQSLVSSNSVEPTGKTLKFSRIVQKSASGNPKSRITFKTWIVRPSKTARLVAEPTSYTYDKPTNPPRENRLVEATVPDKNASAEKNNPDSEIVPYVYNRPTPSSKQIIADENSLYLPPTAPTLSNRLYSTSKTPQPSKQSLNLPPTTYKPASRFYAPSSEASLELSRQYLGPNVQLPQPIYYQNARLVATPTSPALTLTTAVSINKKTPSFSLTKQSIVNTNRNNLTFADILTKEKLDITVNDIVTNTNEILKTASPDELNQYRQNYKNAENLSNNYLAPEFENDINEKLTLPIPQNLQKSEKLIATPSTELEPPISMSNDNYQNSNKLLNLPFFKEPAVPTNTIERTVSLKITIPETIAEYLFKNHSQNNSDNLEILNTGSSNYLVLTNNNLDENTNPGLFPIGKLFWDQNINVSNSHALVYSFLADSLIAAKEYNNVAKQNFIPSTQSQSKNINSEDITDITDKVSRLTSSQYAKDNPDNANFVVSSSSNEKYRDNSKNNAELSQQSALNHQTSSQFSEQNAPNRLYSSDLLRLSNNNFNPRRNTDEIYSGQLYQLSVPEVTSKIYNIPSLPQNSKIRQANELSRGLQGNTQENNIKKLPNPDVEIFPSESLPYPPSRQQLPRPGEPPTQFQKIQDHYENIFADNFLNTDTGITAQVQDKIIGSLPHPLEGNKLVTYEKNKSYYLYTKLEDDNNIQPSNAIAHINERDNLQNAKLIRNNDLANRVTFELIPAIGFNLKDEREKQQLLNTYKGNDFGASPNAARTKSYNQRQDLVTGVDFTIMHPSSKKRNEQQNNVNTILYRGPSSYLAPQSSVGSLGGTQQTKSPSRIEQFQDNKSYGYAKVVPARQFSF